ncbi:MAG: UDPglucose--hexose-phosphate uridylyltransferase [Petroclostridium sp.]|jgi:UDPglucose--hexose-1-phosphate uridylyltransferase|uniref:galactose-1-phosphate uridylyltransferase n=1 Tax=Petroclostridium xylanilyticum TaxID=1792311 RepID=UPI000B986B07|nr:galactose-1-phosphate uridylyltransferase [Petroclostridium xylanilyticum]MBZ4646332.1 galT [Clostridia bacterium]MDK2810595.1 UDPglucose--hexose-phosphate uridylyltransferase [Petroclostridium sp.]
MAELRWNPLIKDWVMIASHRQNRPQMPKDWCPFCPGSGKVPEHYEVYKYDNDFPALSQDPPVPDDVATDIYKTREAYGKCEVILYSPEHTVTLPELPVDHIKKLVDLWTERFVEMKKDEKIKYVFIFENRGEVVGVTMPHPHGQIYGYSFIPKKLELELEACKEHYDTKHSCLICDMIKDEMEFGKRIIIENEDFIAFLPFFSEYPYGMYIASKKHKQNLTQFSDSEKYNLAKIIKETAGTMDALFDYPFPYMMCMHQDPVNSGDFSEYYHFHIEFFPPMRSAEKQKFNASSETGAWAHCNPTAPEEKAEELREAYKRFLSK